MNGVLTYGAVVSGELAGSTTAVQMPAVGCRLVKFKAASGNAGNVYIGGVGVTATDGTTDTTSGFVLAAGAESPWFPVDSVGRFYRISDNAADNLTYIAMK